MKHVRLTEARAHLDELLDQVAHGETLMISPESAPLSQVGGEWPTLTEERSARAREAMERILARRETAQSATVEEILQWRNEGRRF